MPLTPLEPPDSHHLNAALGWLGLGNAVEAQAEFELISLAAQRLPATLEVRWLLLAKTQQWSAAVPVAAELQAATPDEPNGWLHHAYALRRAPEGGLAQARAALLPALSRFPKEPVVPYNLACYACQLGDLEEARGWLAEASQRGGREKIVEMALDDADLKPLWGELLTTE